MAARKTHDLAVGREYQTKSGETKNEWVNIGSRIEWDDGGATLMLKRHINLAGFPGEGDVRVSMFEPKPRDGQQQAPQQARNYSQPKQESAPAGGGGFDDSDIPFAPMKNTW